VSGSRGLAAIEKMDNYLLWALLLVPRDCVGGGPPH
jgi:hypothetical protein